MHSFRQRRILSFALLNSKSSFGDYLQASLCKSLKLCSKFVPNEVKSVQNLIIQKIMFEILASEIFCQ